jgi:4-oxalocrotonate tautomerase
MPLVQITGVGEYLSLEQKQEIIRKVTDAVVSVEGEGLRQVTWVTIQDVQPGAWGVGGTPVTADDLRALAKAGPKVWCKPGAQAAAPPIFEEPRE